MGGDRLKEITMAEADILWAGADYYRKLAETDKSGQRRHVKMISSNGKVNAAFLELMKL